ncbi:hypothetical protein GALL_487700 [mine drainage metagenome]|uniref:Uncharacterized protein n=1 Tax=mine drainage metagenome TaxID=410659 RepID=A0A1J5PPW9_9ZZZZ
MQSVPIRNGCIPFPIDRRVRLALEVGESRLIRRDHPGASTCLDAHVADRHAPLHRESTNRFAAIFDHITLSAARADFGDDRQDYVLTGYTFWQHSIDSYRHCLERRKWQGLSRQHMLDFTGTDSKCESTESTVGAGVRVTADDRHARLSQAQLRPHNVHDALVGIP